MPSVRGGWLVDSTGALQTSGSATPFVFLNGVNMMSDGSVCAVAEASQSRTTFGGLAFDTSGRLIVDASTGISVTVNGFPLTSAGAVAVSSNAVASIGPANIGIDSTGRIVTSGIQGLSILPGGPQAFQVATGSLSARSGQAVTCSRTASAYCTKSDGTLVLLGPNTVRVEPTGLLQEITSSNLCLWSRDLTNAAWTKSNTVAALTAIGKDGAAGSASRLTATANNGTVSQAITSASATRALSMYIQRISGSGTVSIAVDGSTFTDVTSQLSANYVRVSIVQAAVTNPAPTIKLGTAGDAIAVDLVQVESNGYVTSPILTTSAGVVRDSDVLSVANPLNPGNPGTFRVQAKATPQTAWATLASTMGLLVCPAAYGAQNSWSLYVNGAGTASAIDTYDNATAEKFLQPSDTLTSSTAYAYLGTDAAGTLKLFKNGVDLGGVAGGAGTGVITTQSATIRIGSSSSGAVNPFSGWLTDILVDAS